MKFNQLTCQISLGVLAVTALYTLVYSGLTGVLLSAAIGLIAAAFIDEFELVSAITIIFALLYTLFLKRFLMKLEPFANEDDPKHIMGRLSQMKKEYRQAPQDLKNPRLEPAGVYDPSIEGFEDISTKKDEKEGASKDGNNALAKNNSLNQVNEEMVKNVTEALTGPKKVEEEEFQSATNSLFKLGKLPSEHSDGPRLDPAKTLEKAMGALDPNTISSMTTDTKQLIETQKGLMSMLSQMRPVLADGKELLQTFSSMFGSQSTPSM